MLVGPKWKLSADRENNNASNFTEKVQSVPALHLLLCNLAQPCDRLDRFRDHTPANMPALKRHISSREPELTSTKLGH
jgi:hypothetical protein